MKKLLKEPLLHFFALGAVLFAFNAWRELNQPVGDTGERIDVTADVIERLRAGYERQYGQSPDAVELRGLVTAHIREEVLSREALALGLDRDDTIVRRRLAQKMEFLTDDITGAVDPEQAALQRFFEANLVRYEKPGRVSFRHVYFSREKRGAGLDSAVAEALAALEKGGSDEAVGDTFLHGYMFSERNQAEVAATFGPEFESQLSALPDGAWRGPLKSSYGLHLVRVESRTRPVAVKLDEVRAMVLRDFNEDRRIAMNRDIFEKLRARYVVTVDDAALAKAAVSANKTAQR